jgi:hypothetical protein
MRIPLLPLPRKWVFGPALPIGSTRCLKPFGKIDGFHEAQQEVV